MKAQTKGKNFRFEFYGDWATFSRGVRHLESDAFVDGVTEDLERLGHQIEYSLKSHIIKQDLPWKKLSKITVALKHGREEILIDTAGYAASFSVEVNQRWKRYLELTVYPKGNVPDRGVSYQQIAYWHEYGTSRMPERPLWRPVADEIDSMEAFKALQSLNHLMVKMIPTKMGL